MSHERLLTHVERLLAMDDRIQALTRADGASRRDKAKRRAPRLHALLLLASLSSAGRAFPSRAESACPGSAAPVGGALNERVDAHWLPDGSRFWYRRQLDASHFSFVSVDPATAALTPAFDHARLASAWARESGKPRDPHALPIDDLQFSEDGRTLRFFAAGEGWTFECETGALTRCDRRQAPHATLRLPHASRETGPAVAQTFINDSGGDIQLWWHDTAGKRHAYATLKDGQRHVLNTYRGHVWQATRPDGANLGAEEAGLKGCITVFDGKLPPPEPPPPDLNRSPDGQWAAVLEANNLRLRSLTGATIVALSTDGTDDDPYVLPVAWSPDSTHLVAKRVQAGDHRTLTLVESSPSDQLQPKVHTAEYLKPGDRIPRPRLRLFRVSDRRDVALDETLSPTPWSLGDVRWEDDSRSFTFSYNQRGHQVYRVLRAGLDGRVRAIVDEVSPTFIDYAGKHYCHFLLGGRQLIWMSERSGWNHLYLCDGETGRVLNPITQGPWVVRGVERVDDARGLVWFTLSGFSPGEDPYFVHHARVRFDGQDFVLLTPGDGTHRVDWSPSGRYLIDTYSRVDLSPVSVLRESETGREVRVLERADAGGLLCGGWRAPEVFKAKGRDGKTDIWGLIWHPSRYAPEKAYPVVENIYAGPQGAHVPKAFSSHYEEQELADLGFVVVMIDGMGTSFRSKAFHDVCWKNLGDAGFPDRIAWLRAAAAAHPWIDLTRVGIYGRSAGGQNALRGLLTYPDFYKAAVADCGCHDNRMDKIWWNELWMGWPLGPHYAAQSNVTQAHLLRGNLLLVVGELDSNVDPASTMQVVDALIKADKDFELLYVPGAGHGAGDSPYGRRRRNEFFVRTLQR